MEGTSAGSQEGLGQLSHEPALALVLGQSIQRVLRSFELIALVAIGGRFGYQLLLYLDSLLRSLSSFRGPVSSVQGICQVTKRASAPRTQ